jgi:hypothetical protein
MVKFRVRIRVKVRVKARVSRWLVEMLLIVCREFTDALTI